MGAHRTGLSDRTQFSEQRRPLWPKTNDNKAIWFSDPAPCGACVRHRVRGRKDILLFPIHNAKSILYSPKKCLKYIWRILLKYQERYDNDIYFNTSIHFLGFREGNQIPCIFAALMGAVYARVTQRTCQWGFGNKYERQKCSSLHFQAGWKVTYILSFFL